MRASGLLAAALCAALATGAVAGPKPGEVDFEKVEVKLDSGGRHAFVESVAPLKGITPPPAPALILLHDHKQSPERLRDIARFALAERGWLVLYPRGWEREWNTGRKTRGGVAAKGRDDVAYVEALVRMLAEEGRLDPTRIFVAGIGEGGLLAQRLLCESRLPIRGAAIVMATWPVGYYCPRREGVPTLFFHGVEDPAAPYHGGSVPPALRVGSGAAASAGRAVSIAAARNGCQGYQESRLTRDPAAEIRVRARFYSCREPLIHYIIEGAGHHWPGGPAPSKRKRVKYGPPATDPDATQAISDFFESLANR